MASDADGNDVGAVDLPLTGSLAFAPEDATIPTPEEGKAEKVELGEDFRKVGLLTDDGGFEWEQEEDGDPIEFWQDGYTIPSGLANVSLSFTAAEGSPITRELRTGKVPDENGYLTVDGGGSATKYVWFSEEVMRSGKIRRRVAVGRVKTAKLVQSERGTVNGIEFEIEISRDARFNNDHYGEWEIYPGAADTTPPADSGTGETDEEEPADPGTGEAETGA